MFQLLKQIKIKGDFKETNKNFEIMIDSEFTGLKMKEELSQLYDSQKHDIEFYYEGKLLDQSQPFISQGVIENGTIKIQYAIPIIILINEKNNKYQIKLTSKTKTKKLQKHLIQNLSNKNIIVQFYKNLEIIYPDKSLFDQGIQKYDIIQANIKSIGG